MEGKLSNIILEHGVRKQYVKIIREEFGRDNEVEVSFEAVADRVGFLIAAKLKAAYLKKYHAKK